MENKKTLRRSASDRKLSGVLGGVAEYFDLDPTLVRLFYVVLTFFCAGFPGVLLYIIMALVVPKDEAPRQNVTKPIEDNYQK